MSILSSLFSILNENIITKLLKQQDQVFKSRKYLKWKLLPRVRYISHERSPKESLESWEGRENIIYYFYDCAFIVPSKVIS